MSSIYVKTGSCIVQDVKGPARPGSASLSNRGGGKEAPINGLVKVLDPLRKSVGSR